MTCPSKKLGFVFLKSMILKFGFYNPIYLACSYLHVLNKNFRKFILEFSGLFYCLIIKVQGLCPTFVTNNLLLVFTDLLFASAIHILSLCFQLVKNFFILFFEVFQKIKLRNLWDFLLSHPIRKLLLPSFVLLSLYAAAIFILQHLFDIVKNFFHSLQSIHC